MRLSKSRFVGMLAASSLVLGAPALAQTAGGKPATGAPAAAPAAGSLDIKGFRRAAFGMTQAQVRAAIAADFGAATKIEEGANPVDGTHYLLAAVDHLDPAPGSVQIGYVFGAVSKTLGNVNVVWTLRGEPTEDQRAALMNAGQQLTAYFQAGPAPAKVSQGATAVGANALLLYAAIDSKNAAVQITIDGVGVPPGADKAAAAAPPKGPASLRISYAQNVDKPDVKTLKAGSF